MEPAHAFVTYRADLPAAKQLSQRGNLFQEQVKIFLKL